MASVILLFTMGCNKENTPSGPTDNWSEWLGLKEIMETAGYDTKNIMVRASSHNEDSFNFDDKAAPAIVYVGKKNGTPWMGFGHIIDEVKGTTAFDRELLYPNQSAAKSIVKDLGYGATEEMTLDGVDVLFYLIDGDYTYLIIGDYYKGAKNESVENKRLVIHDGIKYCGENSSIEITTPIKANTGYEHDLIAFNACFSKDGSKLYDITNAAMKRLAPMEHSRNYITIPYSHEEFLTVCYYPYIPTTEVVECNFKTAEVTINHQVDLGTLKSDKLEDFRLTRHEGSIYHFELTFSKYSGVTFTKFLEVDINDKILDYPNPDIL